MDDGDPVPISALQHWCYCPRQCGLIHLEQAFEENVHTLRGRAVPDTRGCEVHEHGKFKAADFDGPLVI